MGSQRVDERYDVVWPLARSTASPLAMPARLPDLDGKRIGFVWDYVFRGDEMFALLQRELSSHFDDVSFVPYQTFGNVHGQDEPAILAALPSTLHREEVDAVIVGVGA